MKARDLILFTRTSPADFFLSTRALPLLVALITLAASAPAVWNEFVDWDDTVNLVNNQHYRGLGWEQLRWMFTTTLMGHWIPLTWITFGLDYLLWGMNPVGYHLTNILLHSLNGVLFYFLARRLLKLGASGLDDATLRLGSAAAALFFSIHPLRAESVAWATERRDVLSGLFFLLTLLTYLKSCESDGSIRRRRLAWTFAFFALALVSKSIVMTLPIILIVLDIYPLGRLSGRLKDLTSPEHRYVLKEKLPFLLLGLAGGIVAFHAQSTFLTSLERYPLTARMGMVFYSFSFYLWKTLFPFELSPLYELPVTVSLLDPPFLLSGISVVALTAAFWALRHRWAPGLAIWVSYLVLVAPVSGLVHAGHQIVNDRYSYLPSLGWALLVGAGVCVGIRASQEGFLRPRLARLAVATAGFLFLGLAVLTWQQVQVWRDTDTLWRYALEAEPNCEVCNGNLGTSLVNRNISEPAIAHLERALALRPDKVKAHGKAHGGLGLAMLQLDRTEEAIEHFQRALKQNPADVGVLNNLGIALLKQGKPDEAALVLHQAVLLDQTHYSANANLGSAFSTLGKFEKAAEQYRKAVELKPDAPQPRLALARAYLALGMTAQAQKEYEILKRLDNRMASELTPLLVSADR